MKNSKLLTLGIVLVSANLALAQDSDVIRERIPAPQPPPELDVLIERDVTEALAGQRAQLAAVADRVAEVQADVQRKVRHVQAGGGGFGGMSDDAFGGGFTVATPPRVPRALVIPKEAPDDKVLGEVEEDLGVMAHILGKAVSNDDKTARAMGIAVFGRVAGPSAAVQNLYIEGHGAIFLLNVNFPLQPPPASEEETKAKEAVNNEWEEARREMARPGKGQGGASPFAVFEGRLDEDAWNLKLPVAEYNAEKVEDLKQDLLNALKNAANIRRLKSDETVTVLVTGAEAGMITKVVKSTGAKPGAGKSERVVVAKATAGEPKPVAAPNKLILRVRKTDAEAFQNGKLDFEAFRKKVTLLTY